MALSVELDGTPCVYDREGYYAVQLIEYIWLVWVTIDSGLFEYLVAPGAYAVVTLTLC